MLPILVRPWLPNLQTPLTYKSQVSKPYHMRGIADLNCSHLSCKRLEPRAFQCCYFIPGYQQM